MKQLRLLGIDFGLKKVGLSISEGRIADPYKVIRYLSQEDLVKKIEKIISEEGIGKVVVGVSESKMEELSRKFGKEVSKRLNIPTTYFDETLSSQDAINLSREAGIRSKKRKKLEDAYSATLILQRYLDAQKVL